MAHGFRCTKCDCQQAEHEYNDQGYACTSYQSPDPEVEALLWKQEKTDVYDNDARLSDEQLQAKYRIPGVMLWRT